MKKWFIQGALHLTKKAIFMRSRQKQENKTNRKI